MQAALKNRHIRRAAIARRLLALAPAEAAHLDWDALDRAPDWLVLSATELGVLRRRVGAVTHAPSMRLWIDRGRIAAARIALGERFMQRLFAEASDALPPNLLAGGRSIESALEVEPVLAATGASILLASLLAGTDGPLTRAVAATLAPAEPALVTPGLAQSTIAKACALSTADAAQ